MMVVLPSLQSRLRDILDAVIVAVYERMVKESGGIDYAAAELKRRKEEESAESPMSQANAEIESAKQEARFWETLADYFSPDVFLRRSFPRRDFGALKPGEIEKKGGKREDGGDDPATMSGEEEEEEEEEWGQSLAAVGLASGEVLAVALLPRTSST